MWPDQRRRGQTRGGVAGPEGAWPSLGGGAGAKKIGRRCSHAEGFAVGSDACVSPHHGDALAGHPGLWREGRALLVGRSVSERSAVTAAPPGPLDRYTGLHLEIRVCFYEPWGLRTSFSLLWPLDSVFPAMPRRLWNSGRVHGSGWGRLLSSGRHTPCPLPAHFSLCTEGGGEGWSLSWSHCPALLASDGQVPQLLSVV